MIAFVNGEYLPEEQAVVPALDRGFLYGDGLFETILVYRGRPHRWAQHLERLRKGADWLRISVPMPPKELRAVMAELINRNELSHAIVRVAVSRGVGGRGYSPQGAGRPTLVITCHPAPTVDPADPPRWKMVTSSFRVPAGDRLSQFKTASRLVNVMARAEADAAGVNEALIVNTNGEITEATGANLFWLWRGVIHTSPTSVGALPGITRAVVLELCQTMGLRTQKKIIRADMLHDAEAVFLTQSTHGIIAVESLDQTTFPIAPIVLTVSTAYWEMLHREAAA